MTTSRDLSEKLSKAGLEIESEKYHIFNKVREVWQVKIGLSECVKEHTESWKYIPAPSSDELLAVMPEYTTINEIPGVDTLEITKLRPNLYVVRYGIMIAYNDKSLPEALGLMCLWLLQNGYHYDKEKKCLVKS